MLQSMDFKTYLYIVDFVILDDVGICLTFHQVHLGSSQGPWVKSERRSKSFKHVMRFIVGPGATLDFMDLLSNHMFEAKLNSAFKQKHLHKTFWSFQKIHNLGQLLAVSCQLSTAKKLRQKWGNWSKLKSFKTRWICYEPKGVTYGHACQAKAWHD